MGADVLSRADTFGDRRWNAGEYDRLVALSTGARARGLPSQSRPLAVAQRRRANGSLPENASLAEVLTDDMSRDDPSVPRNGLAALMAMTLKTIRSVSGQSVTLQ